MARKDGTVPSPTMARIAERAGTSVPTVSKVLNGGTDVSEATRARVMGAAHELGYKRKPRAGAVTDGRRTPHVVDVIVKHLEGSWINRVLEGIERESAAAGVDLVLAVAHPDDAWIGRILRRPTLGAIVVLVDASAGQLNMLTTGAIPVVVVDPIIRPPADVASVGVTNWDGGRIAAEHLLELGHSRIGVIGGSRSQLSTSARVDGITTALREAGIDVPPSWLAYADWDRDRARMAAKHMLTGATRPTAIFAGSDVMALGVYDAASELGLSIPEDLSVVGFDDVDEAAWAAPPMTTIQQPIFDMGAAAFRMLHQLDRGAHPASTVPVPTRIELETRLIRRSSTASPATL